jgi:SpoVK/Ycf46/Vps4 family AAA+-type ATPase
LLQRVETFPGVVILATNQIGNLDKAFARRFQAVIHFPTPGLYERIQLWKNTFGDFPFNEEATDALWQELAEKRQLTGANIQNILRRSLLLAYKNNSGLLQKEHIEIAIEQEVEKEKRF